MSDTHFTVISPVDGKKYLSRPFAQAKEIETKIAAARSATKTWAQTPIPERTDLVLSFSNEMKKRSKGLAEAVTWQIGRPLWQADETDRLVTVGNLLAQTAEEALQEKQFSKEDDIRRFTRAVPSGLHLSICAWNYPTAMLAYLVSQPLSAGNVVILKHSPQTPVIAEIAEESWLAAGGQEGVFQFLHLSHEDAEALISAEVFDAVNFIGSEAGGRQVHRAAGGTMTDVHLELGGKDATYIRNDADIEGLVADLAEGCFSNSGQSCCSVERIYVHENVKEKLIEAMVAEAHKWTIGHPLDDKPMIGPVVRENDANRIQSQVSQAISSGAKSVYMGKTELGGAYVPPQILTDCTQEMSIMVAELFGPVACIQAVSSDEEAIIRMNDSTYGLTAGIWTSDEERGLELLGMLDAGMVYLNRCDHADLYLPWGGTKCSGLGRTNGLVGLSENTHLKSFHLRNLNS